MTELLQQAFDAAAKLTPEEQDLLASWILAEVAEEDEFDRKIAATSDKLVPLAAKALEEYLAGETEPLDVDSI